MGRKKMITDEVVLELRGLYQAGVGVEELAVRYGCSSTTVYLLTESLRAILHRKSKHHPSRQLGVFRWSVARGCWVRVGPRSIYWWCRDTRGTDGHKPRVEEEV